jgi:hypothetical protein
MRGGNSNKIRNPKSRKMTKNFLLILTGCILLSSCKKDKTPATPTETVPKIKSETNIATGQSYTYTYNNDGRIAKIVKPSTYYETYDYTPSLVSWAEYSATGVLQNRRYYELNSQGLAIRATYDDPAYSTTYTYNSDKQLLKTSEYQNGVLTATADYFYTNKLPDSSVSKSPLSAGSSTFAYEYYDTIVSTYSEKNYGRVNWGEGSKKAQKKFHLKTYDAAGNFYPNTSYTISYVHEVDAQGNITKVTSTRVAASGTTVNNTVYTYY